MIKLTKADEPEVLRNNAARWTQELIDTLARNEDPTKTQNNRYNHKEIKDALIAETSKKCAYCELKFLAGTYGDIEHIIPKKLRPDLRFSWSNLTIACDVCNTGKGVHDDLIDPYSDDPDDHFRFVGPMITVKPSSNVGLRTRIHLDLNRISLIERRKEKIDDLERRVHQILATSDQATKGALLAALIRETESSSAEFAACARAFVALLRVAGDL